MRETPDPVAIRARGLTKTFGAGEAKVLALRGVDVEFRAGELGMIVGPSGCGKTTLLTVIAGLLGRTGGELSVLGVDPQALGDGARVDFRLRHVGFIFQQFNLIPSLDAAENVAVPLIAAGVRRREAVDRARALLERVGLGRRARAAVNGLSGGEQQRVAIARALVHEPRLVLCDEPTASLDARTGHVVMEMLYDAAVTPERAVVVVTHDSRVFPFAHRIAHMEDGTVRGVETQAPSRTAPLVGARAS